MSERKEEADRTQKTPLVFLSHDSRDRELAHAFAELIRDCSGGGVQTFMSSDHKGTSGLEYGAEWYNAIMNKLDSATDVVALLTRKSLERPWILYEVGVAKGKLGSTVFGLALGIPLERASIGPFAVFQNCGDDPDSLTKLMKQLVSEKRGFAPRDQMIRSCVAEFKARAKELTDKTDDGVDREPPPPDQNLTARQFEEIKSSLRQIFERLPPQNLPAKQLPISVFLQLRKALVSRFPDAWDKGLRYMDDAPGGIRYAGEIVHRALVARNEDALRKGLHAFIASLKSQSGSWEILGDVLAAEQLLPPVVQDVERAVH